MKRALAVLGTALALLGGGCGSGEPPSAAVLDREADDRGVLAERQVGSARIRLADMPQEGLCLIEVLPIPRADGDAHGLPVLEAFPDAGAVGCAPRAAALAEMEQVGWYWMGAQDSEGSALRAGVVPDGYEEAVAADGRRWQIADNLLVIGIEAGAAERLPKEVELRGPAGRRTITLDVD